MKILAIYPSTSLSVILETSSGSYCNCLKFIYPAIASISLANMMALYYFEKLLPPILEQIIIILERTKSISLYIQNNQNLIE